MVSTCRCSSTVERLDCNQLMERSIPPAGSFWYEGPRSFNNAILGKAVEICAERKMKCLVNGALGGGGTQGLDEFKTAKGSSTSMCDAILFR